MAASPIPLRPDMDPGKSFSSGRSTSPMLRAVSPGLQHEESATILAFKRARDTFRKSLPEKEMKKVMMPARPDDVLEEIEKWQRRQAKSKYHQIAFHIRAGLSRLQKFHSAIDLLAQGSPDPATLLWGGIKFALTLYTETFLDSNLIQSCVHSFYVSVLRFWTRACKFYRRSRLWNFFRAVWKDYDAEFDDLERAMVKNRDDVETYDVEYYADDYKRAKARRHLNTCQWVLSKPQFTQYMARESDQDSFLWIYARPGAGKTILSSFLIDYLTSPEASSSKDVLYFYCKNTDSDKNTSTSIIRSLLYQLYQILHTAARSSSLISAIEFKKNNSGQQRALEFSSMWQIFSAHVLELTQPTVILDALDECQDPSSLVQKLKSFCDSSKISVIATSRKEGYLYEKLGGSLSFEIAPEDIDADVASFIEAKVTKNPKLLRSSVRNLIVRRLRCSHGDLRSKSPKPVSEVDPHVIENVQLKNPFLEYASFSWLSHLKDCDKKDVFGVTKAFRDAFDSRATFCWVETCMFLQSDSASRLVMGLEVARDWAEFLNGEHHCVPEPKDCAFLCRWCSALQRMFEEYGATLSQDPSAVHIIELRSIFVDHELNELYDAQSLPGLRESRVQLNYSNSHIRQQTSPPPHRKLRQTFESEDDLGVAFFLHDENRDVYFYGLSHTFPKPTIYVQHVKTGKTLPRAISTIAHSPYHWDFSHHAMSKDGKYTGVVYEHERTRQCLTVVWEIKERLDFRGLMQGEPWARIVFLHTSDLPHSMWINDCISFRDDHLCYTPSGLVHIPSARRTPIPKDLFMSHQTGRVKAQFSSNGDYLFVNAKKGVRKISLHSMQDKLDWTWNNLTFIEAVSPSGLYIITSGVLELIEEVDLGPWSLWQTTTRRAVSIPPLQTLKYRNINFVRFSNDENTLFVFICDVSEHYNDSHYVIFTFFVYDGLASSPTLRTSGQCSLDGAVESSSLHMQKDEASALLVTRKRSIQRVNFMDEISFPDAIMLAAISKRSWHISEDSNRWASVDFVDNKFKVQIGDLKDISVTPRTFDLEQFPGDHHDTTVVRMSPHLTFLLINGWIYNFTSHDDPGQSDSWAPIALPTSLFEDHSKRHLLNSLISPSEKYIACLQDHVKGDEDSRATLLLFEIDLGCETTVQLAHSLPIDLFEVSADFHPALNLIIVTYVLNSEVNSTREEFNPVHVAIVNLETLDTRAVDLSQSISTIRKYSLSRREMYEPMAYFSNCGTFAFLGGRKRIKKFICILEHFQVLSQLRRYVTTDLSFKDSLWNLWTGNRSLHLSVIKPPSSGCFTPTRRMHDIVAVPARLSDSKAFLLLGANDDENMRVLLVPCDGHVPEVQGLSFSFAEAGARLEREEEHLSEPLTSGIDTDDQSSSEDETDNETSGVDFSDGIDDESGDENEMDNEAPEAEFTDELGEVRNEANGAESQEEHNDQQSTDEDQMDIEELAERLVDEEISEEYYLTQSDEFVG
ncbi:MAG: hypothetical protein Q9164_006139 [Protoblastenia rupestris]